MVVMVVVLRRKCQGFKNAGEDHQRFNLIEQLIELPRTQSPHQQTINFLNNFKHLLTLEFKVRGVLQQSVDRVDENID